MTNNDKAIIEFITGYDEDNLMINYYVEKIFKNLPEAKKEIMALGIKRLDAGTATQEEENTICDNLEKLYDAVIELQSAYIAKDLGLDAIESGVNKKGEIYITVGKECKTFSTIQ